jgi:hypothetical protein
LQVIPLEEGEKLAAKQIANKQSELDADKRKAMEKTP